MRVFFILWLFFISNVHLNAQTELIAFKSHSGTMENFSPSEFTSPDFGLAPQYRTSVDSVIYVDSSTVVLVKRKSYFANNKLPFIRKDTLRHHGLWSGQNSPDSIRMELRREGGDSADIQNIKFIGYEKALLKDTTANKKSKKKGMAPVLINPGSDKTPPASRVNYEVLSIIGFLIIFSFLAGLASRLFKPSSV